MYTKKSDINYVISNVIFSEGGKAVSFDTPDGKHIEQPVKMFERYYTERSERDVFINELDQDMSAIGYAVRRLETVPNVSKYTLGGKTVVYIRTGKKSVQCLFHPCDAPDGVQFTVIKYALPADIITTYDADGRNLIVNIARNAFNRVQAGIKSRDRDYIAAMNETADTAAVEIPEKEENNVTGEAA